MKISVATFADKTRELADDIESQVVIPGRKMLFRAGLSGSHPHCALGHLISRLGAKQPPVNATVERVLLEMGVKIKNPKLLGGVIFVNDNDDVELDDVGRTADLAFCLRELADMAEPA